MPAWTEAFNLVEGLRYPMFMQDFLCIVGSIAFNNNYFTVYPCDGIF